MSCAQLGLFEDLLEALSISLDSLDLNSSCADLLSHTGLTPRGMPLIDVYSAFALSMLRFGPV